jgi:hypothetical protein
MIDGGVPLLRVEWTDFVTPRQRCIIVANSKDSFVYTGDAMLDEVTRFAQLVDGGRLLPRQTTAPVANETLDRTAREKTPANRS